MTDARIYRFARSGNDLERIQNAQRIWDEAQHPQGTLAEIYLREHRKLELADDLAGTVLRFHQECPWRDENSGRTIAIPALIAPFRSFHDDEITGVYCIGLNPDGSKSDRSLLGIVRDAAVKLDPLGRKTLWVGDSLEATLAGRQIRFKPAWALGSFGAIAFFPLIEGLKALEIFGAAGEESKRAIKICSRRWHDAGRQVGFLMPAKGLNDVNDMLLKDTKQ